MTTATRPSSIALLHGLRYGPGMTEKMIDVPLSRLHESADNPRKLFGDIGELAESIRKQGLLQPLIARKDDGGKLEVVIGHRRFRASKQLGLKNVSVIIRGYSKQEALEAMISENAKRADVNALELADGYHNLMQSFGLTVEQVAERLSVAKSGVYNTLKLRELIEPIKKMMLQGKLTATHGMRLANVKGERLQERALHDVVALSKGGELPSVRAVERLIREKYTAAAPGRGTSKRQREAKSLGVDVALRKRVLARLLTRIAELVEQRASLNDVDLRTAVLSMADLSDAAREVFQRRGLRPDRLSKVAGAQLRSLVVELPLAMFLALEDGEYGPGVKAVAKAYGLSLADIERNVANEGAAEALFTKE